jgi:hypothetical protein
MGREVSSDDERPFKSPLMLRLLDHIHHGPQVRPLVSTVVTVLLGTVSLVELAFIFLFLQVLQPVLVLECERLGVGFRLLVRFVKSVSNAEASEVADLDGDRSDMADVLVGSNGYRAPSPTGNRQMRV